MEKRSKWLFVIWWWRRIFVKKAWFDRFLIELPMDKSKLYRRSACIMYCYLYVFSCTTRKCKSRARTYYSRQIQHSHLVRDVYKFIFNIAAFAALTHTHIHTRTYIYANTYKQHQVVEFVGTTRSFPPSLSPFSLPLTLSPSCVIFQFLVLFLFFFFFHTIQSFLTIWESTGDILS